MLHALIYLLVTWIWNKNNVIFISATSVAIKLNRDDNEWTQHGEELEDEAEEEAAATAPRVSIPAKLKAVIKFGYDEGMKDKLGTQDFGKWIEGVFTHTQVHYRDPSLGTEINFEVCFI